MALNTDAIVGANPDDCFWHLSSTTGRHVLVGKMRCKKVLLFKPFRVRGKPQGPSDLTPSSEALYRMLPPGGGSRRLAGRASLWEPQEKWFI